LQLLFNAIHNTYIVIALKTETVMSTLYSTSSITSEVSFGWYVPSPDSSNPPETKDIVLPQQTHTTHFGILTDPAQTFPETDALVTRLKGVAIGIRTADCIPLVAYAPDIETVAAIHAGWRGTIGGIAPRTLRHLINQGADPARLQVRFGPGICGDCYEVSPDLAAQFTETGFGECVHGRHLDLIAANILSLLRLGIPRENIIPPSLCTRHSELTDAVGKPGCLPSWRRIPGLTDRLITWIRME
jgi:UPF0124 protein DR_1966